MYLSDYLKIGALKVLYNNTGTTLASENVQSALTELSTLSGTGSGGGTDGMPILTNTLIVDPDSTELIGERYTTWSGANAYAVSQAPSSSSTWSIFMSGTNNEDIVMSDYISIKGNERGTFLTGSVSTTMVYGSSAVTGFIKHCFVSNVNFTGSMQALILMDSVLLNTSVATTGAPPFILYCGNCEVDGGDFSNIAMKLNGGSIKNGILPTGTQYDSVQIDDHTTATLNGGIFQDCMVKNSNTATYNSEDYHIRGGIWGAHLTCTGNDSIYISGTTLLWPVTLGVQDGDITTRNCSGKINFNATGTGIWENSGALFSPGSRFDTSVDDTQKAIDKLSDNISTGTYTPTFTNVVGTALPIANVCMWKKVNNQVTVVGTVGIDKKDSDAICNVTLPIATTFNATTDCSGTALHGTSNNNDSRWGVFTAVVSPTNLAVLRLMGPISDDYMLHFTFTYILN